MVLEIADWRFLVDPEETRRRTGENAKDHCPCAYCRNFYETVASAYPRLSIALSLFGIDPMGPSELMPFTPTVLLACYRVQGQIKRWGKSTLTVGGIPISPETADGESFFLWVGELELPWIQPEPSQEVFSPANQPAFLERMGRVWTFRHGPEFVCS